MKISEFAELTGQTASAVRYYESLGLLKPDRAKSGYRVYSAAEIERMTLIQMGQDLGFSLDEMGLMLSNNTRNLTEAEHKKILSTLNSRKQTLLDTQQKIADQITLIEHLTGDLQDAWNKGECFQLEKLTRWLK